MILFIKIISFIVLFLGALFILGLLNMLRIQAKDFNRMQKEISEKMLDRINSGYYRKEDNV